jgi:hypothetical protein
MEQIATVLREIAPQTTGLLSVQDKPVADQSAFIIRRGTHGCVAIMSLQGDPPLMGIVQVSARVQRDCEDRS